MCRPKEWMDAVEFDNTWAMVAVRYIYIYIYNILKKNCFEPPNTNSHTFTMNLAVFYFLKPNLNSRKKKNVQKKILVFNLRNKKPINQILKNH